MILQRLWKERRITVGPPHALFFPHALGGPVADVDVMKTVAAGVLLATSCAANQPPLVGNGGHAPYFDWNTHSDALALHWTDIPTTALTVEFWYMGAAPYV